MLYIPESLPPPNSSDFVHQLPFASPGEPIVAARIDAIRSRDHNPFMDYQVPSAIISLKQGLGKLIRKGSNRGIQYEVKSPGDCC